MARLTMQWRNSAFFVIPMVVALLIAISIIAVRAQQGGGSTNPDAGLTDAQRAAKYDALRQLTTDQQAKINQQFADTHQSVSDLPRVSSLAFYDGSQYDLAQATVAAHDIVHGTITDQYVVTLPNQPSVSRVVSVISVQNSLKGAAGLTTVELVQAGTPVLRDDGSYALVVNDNDTVMKVGDELVAFSASRDNAGRLIAIPYKVMQIKNGTVIPNRGDDKAQNLSGESAPQLIASIQASAVQQ